MGLADFVTSNATKEEIKDVPPLPIGTYLAMTVGPHTMVKSREKQTDGVEFTYRLLQAEEDVDAEGLQAHLEASKRSLHDVQMKDTFWDSPYVEASMRDFLYDALGIDSGTGIREALAESQGRQFKLHIRHRPSQSNDGVMRMRAEIDKKFAA